MDAVSRLVGKRGTEAGRRAGMTAATTAVACHECHEAVERHFSEPIQSEMLERSLCFNCWFWAGYAAKSEKPEHVRINGQHYVIGDESGRDGMRGYGGRRFVINFTDGRSVTTTNLWHQGDIPAHFLDRLPDNATWGGT